MNLVFVTLEEANRQWAIKESFIYKVIKRYSFKEICENILWAFKWFKNSPRLASLKHLSDYFVCYFFGGRIAGLFNLCQKETDRLSSPLVSTKQEYCYHWCPCEEIDSIKEKGLLPWKEHAFVYITDDYEYIAHNYLPYKTQKLGKDTHFQLVKIKMKELIKTQKVYLVNAAHEFAVAKMIPAKYIEVVTTDGR